MVKKHSNPPKQKSLFPELDRIIATLEAETRQDLVILIIPSHKRNDEPINNQDIWAHSALELFADLYRGATAFKAFKGVYKSSDGRYLFDSPILIESYVAREALLDVKSLIALLTFVKRLGRETEQEAVGVVINNVFHEITDFSPIEESS